MTFFAGKLAEAVLFGLGRAVQAMFEPSRHFQAQGGVIEPRNACKNTNEHKDSPSGS